AQRCGGREGAERGEQAARRPGVGEGARQSRGFVSSAPVKISRSDAGNSPKPRGYFIAAARPCRMSRCSAHHFVLGSRASGAVGGGHRAGPAVVDDDNARVGAKAEPGLSQPDVECNILIVEHRRVDLVSPGGNNGAMPVESKERVDLYPD